jgi:periplasmic divalent cation tolerance protein
MANDVLLAFCTFPDFDTAGKAVRELVGLRLAACGNILPQVHSVYRWKGEVESSEEVLAIFKLESSRYSELETKLRALHPYDVPEIIAFPISKGLPEYLRWVADSCAG